MMGMVISSALLSVLLAQTQPQEISLTISNFEAKMSRNILRAECEARGIRVVQQTDDAGFQVMIEGPDATSLNIVIIDRDGETSRRVLRLEPDNPLDRASLEREIALIIESVVRRWERRKAAEDSPKTGDASPAEALDETPSAEPTRKPDPSPELVVASDDGLLQAYFSDASLTTTGLIGFSGGRDHSGALSGGVISVGLSYGGPLMIGTELRLAATDVEITTLDLRSDSATITDWSLAVSCSLLLEGMSSDLHLETAIAVGNQILDADGAFEGSGAYSAVAAGLAYHIPLIEGPSGLDIVAQAGARYTWIGATFVNAPNLEAYRPSRISLDAQLGLAWQLDL